MGGKSSSSSNTSTTTTTNTKNANVQGQNTAGLTIAGADISGGIDYTGDAAFATVDNAVIEAARVTLAALERSEGLARQALDTSRASAEQSSKLVGDFAERFIDQAASPDGGLSQRIVLIVVAGAAIVGVAATWKGAN